MPHLAPMNWIMGLFLFWTFITLANSMNWWTTSMLFTNTKNTHKLTKKMKWNWL